jgi:hypothetical protein
MFGLFAFSIGCSAVLLWATWMLAKSRFGLGGVVTLMVGMLVATSLFMPLFHVGLQAFLTLLVCVVAPATKSKVRTLMIGAAAAMFLVHGYSWYSTNSELAELHELRREDPITSLEQRLRYETASPHEVGISNGENVANIKLDSDVASRLEFGIETPRNNWREHSLSALHDRAREDFIRARGFGVSRMIRIRRERVVLPEAEPIPLPPPRITPQYESGEKLSDGPLAADSKDESDRVFKTLLALHDDGQRDFLDARRFGYVESRVHVVGFESHQFTRKPTGHMDDSPQEWMFMQQEWQITKLQLVSLLKHKTPQVYESKNLPRMDELSDAGTRPLDDFEAASLSQLETQKDLVVESATNRIRMLGSLRAGTTCLKCHQVPRGKLLGAFSYQLDRKQPLRSKVKAKVTRPST